MTTTGQRMLHSDAFAWYMEKDPVLRSTVVAIVRLDRSPDWPRLRARIDRLTRLVPRLRMRVQVPPMRIGPPRWTVDETFDLDFHLRRGRLSGPGNWEQVLDFARLCAMDDFDRSRPLWEFTLLEGLADGGAALVHKLHHSLTDGIGGVQLAALVIDQGPDELPLPAMPDEPDGAGEPWLELTARTVVDDLREAAVAAQRIAGAAPSELVRAIRHPVRTARDAIELTGSVGRIVAPVNRQFSALLGTRHTRRLLATMDVPVTELHDAAVAVGCHLNDAYLAALTEGVRLYHAQRGESLERLRVTIPVSIRGSDDPIGGNRITLTRIQLPAGVDDAAERISKIGAIMQRWRTEPALDHTQEIAFGLNLLPRPYLGGVFKRIELLASDVPGMPQAVWLAGAQVTGYYGFGPTIGAALNATLMSYAGTCNIGVNIDTSAVDDPGLMLKCLHQGFDDVLALGRVARERLDALASPDHAAHPHSARPSHTHRAAPSPAATQGSPAH